MPILELSRSDAPAMRARALVFEAPVSRALLTHLEQIAPSDATVLVTGETGTGKEIVARYLHDRSARSSGPFVAVNCGALTPSLLESELFGHERGAFTGALASKVGWFEEADKGTLFLDEVADLPLAAQVKLLRVLQEREVVRVGARRPVRIDVRLVAATNGNLEQAVADGRFREDLYYRLHVAHVAIAPLRDRAEDLPPLALHFLRSYAARLGIVGAELGEDALRALLGHPWPGNIRELENVIHRALLVAPGGRITSAHLRLAPVAGPRSSSPPPPGGDPPPTPAAVAQATRALDRARPPVDARTALEEALVAFFEDERPGLHEEIEEIVFRTAFRVSDNNQLRTARLLGISRNIVRARLLQHGLLSPASRRRDDRDDGESGSVSSEVSMGASAGARRQGRETGARTRVRIGYQGFGALSLVKATGALEEALSSRRVDVLWTECATGMHVIDALAAGALDLGVVGEAPPVFAQASCAPVVYLASEPPAPEGEAIVVLESSSLRSVAELRGKSLAVCRGANVVYFVVRALEEAGLELEDIELRSPSPLEARAAFARGEVDAWAIWNPILASVAESTALRVLRDAQGLAHNRAFYVGRRSFADAHPDLVQAFVGQVGAVGRWATVSPDLAARTLASHLGLPQPSIAAALAQTAFDARPIEPEAVASQQDIADTFHRLALISRPIHVQDAVWSAPAGRVLRSA